MDELAHTNVPGSGRTRSAGRTSWNSSAPVSTSSPPSTSSIWRASPTRWSGSLRCPCVSGSRTGCSARPTRSSWWIRHRSSSGAGCSTATSTRPRWRERRCPTTSEHDRLTALRELALRFLADETEEQLIGFLRSRQEGAVWETHERILVGVTTAPGTDAIVRRAARMAQRIKADLEVLHVQVGKQAGQFPDDQLIALRQSIADVGAEWNEIRGDDPAQALFEFARGRHVTQIVIGSSKRSRWREVMGGGSIVWKISRLAAPAAIDVHIIARRDAELGPTGRRQGPTNREWPADSGHRPFDSIHSVRAPGRSGSVSRTGPGCRPDRWVPAPPLRRPA